MLKSFESIRLIFLGAFLIFIFSNCKKDELMFVEPEVRAFPKVDERLWIHFEAFEKEAAERGIEIDLVEEAISGTIAEIPGEHVAGQCSYNSLYPGRVTVDQEFFENSSSTFIEFIVFHELGHCHLLRGHREDANQQGTCVSLMRSGVEDCRDNYNLLTRERYVDELFFPERF